MCGFVVFRNKKSSYLLQSGVAGVPYGIWRWEQCNGGMSRPLLGVRQLPYSKLVPHMQQELTTARFRYVSFIHHPRRPVCCICMFPLPQSALSAVALSFHRQHMLSSSFKSPRACYAWRDTPEKPHRCLICPKTSPQHPRIRCCACPGRGVQEHYIWATRRINKMDKSSFFPSMSS